MRTRDFRRRPFWYLGRRPDTVRSEVDEELGLHLEMRVEELRSRGLKPIERQFAKPVQAG